MKRQPKEMAVKVTFRNSAQSPAPYFLEKIMETPTQNPLRIKINRFMMAPEMPVAAKASFPRNRPMIRASAVL